MNFPKKTFYWCSSRNFSFSFLPQINAKTSLLVSDFNTKFTGEYDTILSASEGLVREIKLDDEDSLPIQIKVKNVTELDRLAYVVSRVEDECHAVPEGAYKLTPISELRPNEAF